MSFVGITRQAAIAVAAGMIWHAPACAQNPTDSTNPLQAAEPWRVVILHNADFLLPGSTIMDQALREALVRLSPRPLELYGETLDVLRYPQSTEAELVALLKKKHSGHRIDLVMARAQGGLDFALKHKSELWPNAPLVFYNNVGDTIKAGTHPFNGDITGLLIDLDPAATLDLLQRMHPGIQRLYIVGGVGPYDVSWKRRVQALLAERKASPQVTWLDHLPLPELIEAVGRLPDNSVVLYTSVMRDAGGYERINQQVAEMVARAASVPVYGFIDTYIGRGIVGGDVADLAAEGREAAKLALRVLQGEPASSIPIRAAPPAHCVVDAHALTRWHIDESKLPSSCEVRFREPSVWRDHREYVAGGIAAVLLQSILIAGLLIQRRRVQAARAGEANRRSQLERSLAFERLLVQISSTLMRGPLSDPKPAITQALRRIGEFLGAQRASLWSLGGDGRRAELTHSWAAAGVPEAPTSTNSEQLPTIFERVWRGDVVALSSLDELSENDRQSLRLFATSSILAVPLMVDGFTVGALSFASVREERAWPTQLIPRVRLIGEVFASVLLRQRYATKVQEAQTETAQYRERLAHLVRVHTVGEMSAAIAHEVNQPLMAIENYALAANRRIKSNNGADVSKLKELLDKIAGQAARAGDVLKRLRSIVKKHESEATEFDLGTLVYETVNLVEMESRLKDIRVEVAVESDLPTVNGDDVQIQQVVLNLVRNGVEAMEESQVIDKLLRVEVQDSQNDHLIVRVIDHGKGVNPADRAHIFEPFYSTKDKGLGIGLAICRSIVEAHGGRLSYAVNPSGGSMFEFTLPTAEEKVEQ
jgi:C4-dicarboxylate-specific signal transduction histidine kinase